MKRTMLFLVALICLLVSSATAEVNTATTVVPKSGYPAPVYKICVDGLLFYIIDTVVGQAMVQVFEPSKELNGPPQVKVCTGN